MTELLLRTVGQGQAEWRLTMSPEVLVFASADGQSFSIPRSGNADLIEVIDGLPGRVLLRVWRDPHKLKFLVPRKEASALVEWLGPPTEAHLRATLKRRYAASFPIAVIALLPSLRLAYWASQGVPLNPTYLIGTVIPLLHVPLWLHARLAPRPYLFLLEAAWFGLIAAKISYDIISRSTTPILWLFVALVLSFAYGSVMLFRRFSQSLDPYAQLRGPAV